MAHLFDPLSIRDLELANRVFVSPMCEYSSTDGYATDWHLVHLGSRAVGAAGRVVRLHHEPGRLGGMEVADAGRKASTWGPWEGLGTVPADAGGWRKVVAPSAVAFADHYPLPQALTDDGIREVVAAFG